MIAGYLPDAVPVNFREDGPLSREEIEAMASEWRKRKAFFKVIKDLDVSYVILESGKPLTRSLAHNETAFTLIYSNELYSMWRVEAAIDTLPVGDLVK
jgi:hypothetical protein